MRCRLVIHTSGQEISTVVMYLSVCHHVRNRLDQEDMWTMFSSGVFFLACNDFGRMLDSSFPTWAFFWYFFSKVEISLPTLISLLRPGSVHSGLASCDDCECD